MAHGRRSLWLVPADCRRPGSHPAAPSIWPCKRGNTRRQRVTGRTSGVGSRCGNAAEAKRNAHGGAGAFEGPGCRIRRRPGPGSFGRSSRSQALADELERRFPEETFAKFTYVPVLRALSALGRGRPADSMERLHIALPYELAVNGLNFSHILSRRSALGLCTRRGVAGRAPVCRKPRPNFRKF